MVSMAWNSEEKLVLYECTSHLRRMEKEKSIQPRTESCVKQTSRKSFMLFDIGLFISKISYEQT